jgi:dipeptidyl aminopeptidase/acylaminoacyl peptidase
LFVRDDTLMAQAFDARAGQVSGEAIPIAAGVSIPARGPYTPVTGSETGVVVYARTEQTEGTSQLLWVERSGKSIDSAIGAGSSPSLSPDGRFVAYVRNPNVRSEVWVRDLASGREVRLTADESRTTTPLWAPTSDRLLFRSERGPKPGDLYQRASSGAGRDELLIATANNKIPDQWSRDGRYIGYVESRGTTAAGWRLWTLPVSQGPPLRVDGKPMLFLADGSGETQGQLSPDGRWMAYVSPEGGREEVYVRPFPAAGDSRWKVSAEGGVQPRWRADGKELYFVATDGRMMAATIQTAASRATASAASVLDVGVPVPLFETHLVGGVASRAYQYDVTPDGKHFLVATTSPLTAPVLSVEVNWSARMADH